MKINRDYKLSLRMRVTLFTAMTMICVCSILSYFILKNVNLWIVTNEPVISSEGTEIIQENNGDIFLNDGDMNISSESTGREYLALNRTKFLRTSMIIVLCILFPGILIVYFIMGFALKPVYKLKKNIADINGNDLAQRIDSTSNGVELNSLANSFNQLLERIEMALEREKSFTAGASHELKTPLAVMKANLEVLYMSGEPTKEELEETMEVVGTQVNRMIKLVDDLFAMYELRGYDLGDVIYVDKIINEVVSEHKESLMKKNINIHVSNKQCMIKGNLIMFKHAVSNLLQNAIKFNFDYGKIDIIVEDDNNDCVIKVIDEGIGINSNAAEHIFEAFYREDKSRSRKIGGAGLGLSIVKSIVEQHGGSISYQANNPKGSVFIVSIPKLSLLSRTQP